jgi:hypothetical protein
MKAPIAQAGREAAFSPGYAFFLFLGPRNLKMNLKNSDFGWVQI